MIRAVLDANVIASSLLNQEAPPARIVDLWRAHRYELVISEHVLIEITRTLAKPYFVDRINAAAADRLLALLRTRAQPFEFTRLVYNVATHVEDDLVLSTALSGNADYLVTGDRRFRQLGSFEGVTLLTPVEFLTVLDRATADDSMR